MGESKKDIIERCVNIILSRSSDMNVWIAGSLKKSGYPSESPGHDTSGDFARAGSPKQRQLRK